MAVRTFFEPRALVHEMARLFRPVTDEHHTLDSLKRGGWSCELSVDWSDKTVPLSFFELPFQPRFLLQELTFPISKMDGVGSGRWSWLRKCDRLL